MEYRYQLRGTEHMVRIKPEPRAGDSQVYVAEIGDHVYHVRLERAQCGRLHFTLDDRRYEAITAFPQRDEAGIKHGYLALTGDGTSGEPSETRHFEFTCIPHGARAYSEADPAHARGAAAGIYGARGNLEAQMPGQVVEVMVAEGDRVSSGQLLLVLEAMKMTMRVVAPMDGRVGRVMVAQGDRVERGQQLVDVEPADTPDTPDTV